MLSQTNAFHSCPIPLKCVLILSPHLRLVLPSGPFPPGFHTKLCTYLSCPPYALHACTRPSYSVKCSLEQALRLCTGRTAHRVGRGIALLFPDHCTRRGWGVSVTPRLFFTPGKDSLPIVQEAVWAPGTVWTDAKNLAPTGIRSPDRPARSQSLYGLSYRPILIQITILISGEVHKLWNSLLRRIRQGQYMCTLLYVDNQMLVQ